MERKQTTPEIRIDPRMTTQNNQETKNTNQQKPQNTQGHIRDQNKGKIVQTFNQLNGKECRPPKKNKNM